MEMLRKGLWSVIKRFIVAVISTIGVVVSFGFILDKLESAINARLFASLGTGAILFTAAIGTPLHETAHWLGCKLFGFNISEVQLFRPVAYKYDGVLGYVSFSYSNDSIWQKLGCVFVGIAPMIFGVLFILLTILLIKPEIFSKIKERTDKADSHGKKSRFLTTLWAVFSGFWVGLFSVKKLGIIRAVICLYICASIAMHMTISEQDIYSAVPGLGILLLIYLVFAVMTAMIGNDFVIPGAKVAAFISAFLSIGLVADTLLLLATFVWGGIGSFKGLSYYALPVRLNKYVEVSVDGYNHYGQARVTLNTGKLLEKNIYFSTLNTPKTDIDRRLSNGDIIMVSWPDSEILDEIERMSGKRLVYSDFEYTVKNLAETDEVDPFAGAEISFSGVNGHGLAHIQAPVVDELPGLNVSYGDNNLKNGDEVTVRINADSVNSFLATYNKLPYPTEKTYTVMGLPVMVSSINDLDANALNSIIEKGGEVIEGLDDEWTNGVRIDSSEYIGNILQYDGSVQFSKYNQLNLLYKIHVHGDTVPEVDFDYYIAIQYENLLLDESKLINDLDDYVICNNSFTKTIGYKTIDGIYHPSVSFWGYESLDDAIQACTYAYSGYAKYEKNVSEQ